MIRHLCNSVQFLGVDPMQLSLSSKSTVDIIVSGGHFPKSSMGTLLYSNRLRFTVVGYREATFGGSCRAASGKYTHVPRYPVLISNQYSLLELDK